MNAWASGTYKKPEFNATNCQKRTEDYRKESIEANFYGSKAHRFAKLITRARDAVSLKKVSSPTGPSLSGPVHRSVIHAVDASSEPEPDPQSDQESPSPPVARSHSASPMQTGEDGEVS